MPAHEAAPPATAAAPTPRPPRQEQEPAATEVTEVGPGVLRCQLPISMPGLGHVNCYALEDERGVALVDPGLPGPASYAALLDRLRQAGVPVQRVHTLVVTHSHPDHFGGVGRLRVETGAEVVGHRSFSTWFDPGVDVDAETASEAGATPPPVSPYSQPTPWGGAGYDDTWRRQSNFQDIHELIKTMGSPHPSRRLDDADVIRLAGREWVAVHTPGHTPDHLCLFDPAEHLLLSGDHVLPTITPHISGLGATSDPLAEFFASLDRMHDLPHIDQVLPAHGHPFTDLDARVDAIKHHHEDRLAQLRRISHDLGRPATVMELSSHLFSARAQGPMADSETYAHVEHLRLAGEAEVRSVDGVLEYVVS
jgi:glyoxylase-like metal-dependent hydrolase (beta-lactamase superfamily II)